MPDFDRTEANDRKVPVRGTHRRSLSSRASRYLMGALAAMALMVFSAGAAFANSSGYNPSQNDCQWNNDAWNTPAGQEYPGCHNIGLNVESGGTTNGNPDSNNTRYVEYGDDQEPVDPNSKGTPTELSLGYPGNTGDPHAGCVAANTDGTGGGPAPAHTAPETANKAENSKYGCGSNAAGDGLEANYDVYSVYCPVAADAKQPCEDKSYSSTPVTLTTDSGGQQDLSSILTHGLLVYYGMDDNFDNTEHDGYDGKDGTNGAINGPSDGGGLVLSFTPQTATATPSATNPEGVANASAGSCADAICEGVTTQQQTIYYGCYNPKNPSDKAWNASGTDGADNPENDTANNQCAKGTPESTDAFQNSTPAASEESPNCNSGGPDGTPADPDSGTEQPCYKNANGTPNPGSANSYREHTPQQVNDEPGVQTYSDPDPERSPAAPFELPGAYAGTCGVFLNDKGGMEPGVVSTATGGAVTGPDPGWIVDTDPSAC